MYICDWSSDVCSSDLPARVLAPAAPTTLGWGYELPRGSICGPEPGVNHRVTQLCPDFLFLNCLPACLAPPRPCRGLRHRCQRSTGQRFRRGSSAASTRQHPAPVHAGILRRWGSRLGTWGGASALSPPLTSCGTHCLKGIEGWGLTPALSPQGGSKGSTSITKLIQD